MANENKVAIRLTHDCILGEKEFGQPFGKTGEVHHFDRTTAAELVFAERGVRVEKEERKLKK